MADRKIKFSPPQGIIPETVKDGDTFDLVCSFRVEGGQVCLIQMGDVKMPGYHENGYEKGGEKESPKYGDYAKMVGPMESQPT